YLRELYPELAAALVRRAAAVRLPADVRLRLALARGTQARVTGPIVGSFLIGQTPNGRPLGIASHAQIYFPPLAWQLSYGDWDLLDLQGWADVSDWLERPADEVVALPDLCPKLP